MILYRRRQTMARTLDPRVKFGVLLSDENVSALNGSRCELILCGRRNEVSMKARAERPPADLISDPQEI
jgi:hypothetical protein